MRQALKQQIKKTEDQLFHIFGLLEFYENLNISNEKEEYEILNFLNSLRTEQKRLQSKVDDLKNFLQSDKFVDTNVVVDLKLKSILNKLTTSLVPLNEGERKKIENQSYVDTTRFLEENILGSTSMLVENKRRNCRATKLQKLQKFKDALLENQPLTPEEKDDFQSTLINSFNMSVLTKEEYELCQGKLKTIIVSDGKLVRIQSLDEFEAK